MATTDDPPFIVRSSASTEPVSLDVNGVIEKIPSMSVDEKRALALSLRRIKAQRGRKGADVPKKVPQTDDELWDWIVKETGYKIPRVAVCPDHCAPFDFVADFFFERERSLLLMGSREMGKTLMVAIVHYANAVLRPGTESLTFGAIESQAKRAYKHVKEFIFTVDDSGKRVPKSEVEGDPLRSETRFKNGSLIEIITGSKSGVNSPHPQKVHADEVDLMEEEIWNESRSMASSRTLPNGKRIRAQDVATSTRKSAKGLMQTLINEVEEAERKGFKPPRKLYAACIFENAKEVPECRTAPAAEREARLKELGRDQCDTCDCHTVVKSEWGPDTPRTLESVCKGRFFRSRGWMDHEDIEGKFMELPMSTWTAQMECRRPEADGLYLPNWTRERFCVCGWIPRAEYGPIWQGVDWGGEVESGIEWIQGPLHRPVEIMGYQGVPIIVPQRAYVVFDELYEANVGSTRLADKVVAKEVSWRRQLGTFTVKARFADMAGRQSRNDWREHDPPLRTVWYIEREVEATVKCVQGLVEDARWYVDVERCPNVCDEAESWRQKNGKEVKNTGHLMAGNRYCLTNVEALMRRQNGSSTNAEPVARAREGSTDPTGATAYGGVVSPGGNPDTEQWRGRLGYDINQGANGWRLG